jgi:hypothetical protein
MIERVLSFKNGASGSLLFLPPTDGGGSLEVDADARRRQAHGKEDEDDVVVALF